MCGIVGYTGKESCIDILLSGLKMLEYRGYDSAGIAYAKDRKIKTVKSQGRISALEERLNKNEYSGAFCGIGHTRWATHGAPSDTNSHPHSTDNLSLVHNGIIENYKDIENMLTLKGYTFLSQTDTERAAKLIDSIYNDVHDPISALFLASNILKGSYAFGIIFHEFPDKIYAMRKDSPLILAKDEKGAYLASDIPAILPHTKEYSRLNEGIVACLSPSNIELFDENKNKLIPKFESANWSFEQATQS